jgi:hypothetical protein
MVRHRMMSFFGLAFVLLACGVVHGIDVVSLAEKCLPDNKLYKSSPGAVSLNPFAAAATQS